MATTYQYTVKETKRVEKSSSVGDVTFTFPSFSVPLGEKFKRYKVTNSNGAGSSTLPLQGKLSGVGWGNWDTHKSYIDWDGEDDKKANVVVRNVTQSSFNVTITITFETEDLGWEAVTAGEKILAADRLQTGTGTTVGNIIKDSHFTAGTIAYADSFNSEVLGQDFVGDDIPDL